LVGTAIAQCRPAGDAQSVAPTNFKELAMSKHDSLVRLAISGVLALSGAVIASNAVAADDGTEQCAGITKAGKNDCATSTNDCHGHVTTDGNAEAWIYLPKGTCERISGGHVVQVKVPTKSE
jgi:uncharacterized membrane protein